jgi:hypothetical protein
MNSLVGFGKAPGFALLGFVHTASVGTLNSTLWAPFREKAAGDTPGAGRGEGCQPQYGRPP